jgi:hypothetical protein
VTPLVEPLHYTFLFEENGQNGYFAPLSETACLGFELWYQEVGYLSEWERLTPLVLWPKMGPLYRPRMSKEHRWNGGRGGVKLSTVVLCPQMDLLSTVH